MSIHSGFSGKLQQVSRTFDWWRQLTVLVPTRNRPEFLARMLRYTASFAPIPRTLVLDSSDGCATRDIVNTHRRDLDFEHITFDPAIDVMAKILEGMERVETPYVVLSGDDDLMVVDAWRDAVRFLEDELEYAVAHGVSAVLRTNWTDEIPTVASSMSYRQSSLHGDSPVERLQNHLSAYATTFYSVHRTYDLLRNWREVLRCPMDYRLAELVLSCMTVIQGKVEQLNRLYMVRESHSGSASSSASSFLDVLTGPGFAENLPRSRDLLATRLAGSWEVPLDQARELVWKALWGYVGTRLQAAYARVFNDSPPNQVSRSPFKQLRALGRAGPEQGPDPLSLASVTSSRSPYRADFGRVLDAFQDAGYKVHMDKGEM